MKNLCVYGIFSVFIKEWHELTSHGILYYIVQYYLQVSVYPYSPCKTHARQMTLDRHCSVSVLELFRSLSLIAIINNICLFWST